MDLSQGQTIHLRLLSGDPTASFDCVHFWLPRIERYLANRFPIIAGRDIQLITAAALDALFTYTAHPHRFDPSRSGLANYLRLLARRDLQNALSREESQWRRAVPLEEAASLLTGEGNPEEEVVDRVEVGSLWEAVRQAVPADLDRKLLALMLSGERSTLVFARVLGVADRPEPEQKAVVKRAKDRLNKRLARLGDQIRG